MSTLRDKLKSAGVDTRSFQWGEVYLMSDEAVHLPEAKLRESRALHAQRPVVVVQTEKLSQSPTYPVVLVCPISSKKAHLTKHPMDLEVAAGEGGLDRDSVVHARLVQPILKVDLQGKPCGRFTAERCEEIWALLVSLLTPPEQEEDTNE